MDTKKNISRIGMQEQKGQRGQLEELRAWLRLTLEPGIGSVTAKNLLMQFGFPQTIFETKFSQLMPVVGEKIAYQLREPCSEEINTQIDKTLEWLNQDNHHILTLADTLYPKALLDTYDPPLLLYVDGNLSAFQKPAIAVVGTRHPTLNGAQNARAFGKYLASQGWCIVSGLAKGIDASAHEGALLANVDCPTIAVMGTGINRLYPAENKAIALGIRHRGALISEFPLDTPANAFRFPMRNRIVAGLSRGVLVVEAARKSGSLITAKMAGDLGKEIFAIPGSIHSPLSRGCHALIRQGAKLVETGQDILEELGYAVTANAPEPDKPSVDPEIPEKFKPVLEAMGFEAISIEELTEYLSLSIEELSLLLTEMQLQSIVVKQVDGKYQRVFHNGEN